jgi:hypothetical protein
MERKPNVPESYRSGGSRSSPALPGPPPEEPDRLQFHLRHLLGFMLACAVLAAGLGYFIRWLATVPHLAWLALTGSVQAGIALAILAYFLLRVPRWISDGRRFRRRWQAIQRHRRELAQWHREQEQTHPPKTRADEQQHPEG